MQVPVDNAQVIQAQEILQNISDSRGLALPRIRTATDSIDDAISREMYEAMEAFEFKNRLWYMRFNENFRENINYVNGHQWSTDQMMDLIAQGRKPYVFDQLGSFFNALCGEQVTQRTEARVIPLTDISEMFAESMNHYLRWVFAQNRYPNTVSEVFRDGVAGGVGVVSTTLDYRNPFSHAEIEQCYPLEFMWDQLTATPDPSDSDYLWRGNFTAVSAAIDEFPDSRDEIMRHAGTIDRYMLAWYTLRRPTVASPANRLWLDSPAQTWSIYNRDMVFKREFFHRRYEDRYVVRDGTSNTEAHFMTEAEAQDFAEATWRFYSEPFIQQNFGVTTPQISEPYIAEVPFVDKYVFFGTELVFRKTYETKDYPYKIYSPTAWHGDLTSKMEHGKGPQRFINRIMMFVDEIASGWKGSSAINKQYLDDKWTDDEIRQYGIQSNPLWIVDKDPESFPMEGFQKNFAAPQNGQFASELLKALKDNIDKMFGGANSIGLEAFSGQSGKSAAELSMRAARQNIPLYDKLRWFNQEVAEQMIYYSQFLDPSVRMTVTNEYNEPSAITFLDKQLGTIFQPEDLSFSVEITQEIASQGEREANYNRLITIGQTLLPNDPAAAQAMMPLILKNADIDPSDRRKFTETYQQIQQQQSQAQQDEINYQRSIETQKLEIEKLRLQLKKYEIDKNSENTTKLMLSGKVEDMDPALLASAMNKVGIDADPETVMQDQAVGGLMKQAKRDMAQQHFDALTPAWQREAANKSAKGVETPKDRKNRDMKKVS